MEYLKFEELYKNGFTQQQMVLSDGEWHLLLKEMIDKYTNNRRKYNENIKLIVAQRHDNSITKKQIHLETGMTEVTIANYCKKYGMNRTNVGFENNNISRETNYVIPDSLLCPACNNKKLNELEYIDYEKGYYCNSCGSELLVDENEVVYMIDWSLIE